MVRQTRIVFVWLALIFLLHATECAVGKDVPAGDGERERNQRRRYTASWAVEITEGGDKAADKVAQRHGYRNLGKVANFDNIYHFALRDNERARAPIDSPYTAKSSALLSERSVGFADQQFIRPVYKRSYTVPVDPRFREQWFLLNTGQYGDQYKNRDLNIEKVWLQGLTGCNVTVGIVDDGFEYIHPDLRQNYAPAISYDFVDGDADPINDQYDWHGTRCAGLVSAAKDGAACGVGVAYNAKFAGLRLLGAFTDLNEASSLSYANDVIDIYSNSWGPCDEGCVDGPMRLTELALKTGAQRGRDGKGSIFVWASGNGGIQDDCGADGYTTSVYTIAVGSIGVAGEQSYYDEECSAKMAVTFVTDDEGYSAVTTTATDELCVYGFGGTSAACPMMAGAIALTLEANPDLTWRDIMYLVVFTSNPSLTSEGLYTTNAAGIRVSRQFGFGVLDAEAMVSRGRHWVTVPPQLEHRRVPSPSSGRTTSTRPVVIRHTYTGSITYLEHVVVNMTIESGGQVAERGHLGLEILSPSGTQSILLKSRPFDNRNDQFYRWPFMSVAFWGENPRGVWQLTIRSHNSGTYGDFTNLAFQFFGTSSTPVSVSRIPNRCHSECARGCAAAGSRFCDACANLRNAYTLECIAQCPSGYTERNGYCYSRSEPVPVCNSKLLSLSSGSCADAGYKGCCTEGKCDGTISSTPFGFCHCDDICHAIGDCCNDIAKINCTRKEITTSPMSYITLRSTSGVDTLLVPRTDDGASPVIRIPIGLPIGNSLHSTVYVGTNGYMSFDKVFTEYATFPFPGAGQVTLVAPFFSDIDISKGTGSISYEVHTRRNSESLFSKVNSIINEEMGTEFFGAWLLVAEWRNAPEFGSSQTITNTFQGIAITDFTTSYAVFIYKCRDLGYSGSATIGFTAGDVLFRNHRLSGYTAKNIACINSDQNQWVNLVFKLTREDLQPIVPIELYDECALELDNCEQECIDIPGTFVCSCFDGYALQRNGVHCFPYCSETLVSETGDFNTPSWPESYPQSFDCEWIIDLTETLENLNYIIVFRVDASAYGMTGDCEVEYIEFFDGVSVNSSSLGRFCGHTPPPSPIGTTGVQAKVVFHAHHEHADHLRGVRVTYGIALRENECEENNGNCAQVCRDTAFSYECSCRGGYTLSSDGHSCDDIDECAVESSHDCEHICTNTLGSYDCSCNDRFMLGDDGRSCLPSCGGVLSTLSGSFQTPGWPEYYPELDFRCEWRITMDDESYIIRLVTDSSRYGILGNNDCPTDYLAFYDGPTTAAASLGRFCFLNTPPVVLTSSHQAMVVFQATSRRHPVSRRGARVIYEAVRIVDECITDNGGCEHICEDTSLSFTCSCTDGFSLNANGKNCDDINECSTDASSCEQICTNTNGSYSCSCEESYALNSDGRTCRVSCGGTYTASRGSFHTPGWPRFYPLDFRCEWLIRPSNANSNMIILLTVNRTAFGIHGRNPCITDYLKFHDGNTTDVRSMGLYCKFDLPDPLYTTSNQALVVFQASTIPHLPSRVGVQVFYQTFQIVNECEDDNGGCEGTCVNTFTSYECQCDDDGYSLGSDGLSCEDIDECSGSQSGYCEHICVNTEGSFHCTCSGSFALADDGRSCVPVCGGNIDADSGSIATPGWPVYYPSLDFTCEWTFKTSNNSIFDFAFAEQFGVMGSHPCSSDYIEIFDGLLDTGPSLGRFCSLSVPASVCTSSNCATIVFKGSSLAHPSDRIGANVTFTTLEKVNECETNNGGCEQTCVDQPKSYLCNCRAGYTLATNERDCDDIDECSGSQSGYCEHICVNTEGSFHCTCRGSFALADDGRSCVPVCGGNIDADSGSIATPGWPVYYPSLDFTCEWTFKTSNNSIFDFAFAEEFGVMGSHPCSSDYIEIFDGLRDTGPSLGRFCSLSVPASVCTSSNCATIVFKGSSLAHPSDRVGANVTFTTLEKVNECETNNGGCEQTCVDQPKSYLCICRAGYTLATNGRDCDDIDECSGSQSGYCEHICVNTEGSFHCTCSGSFALADDGRSCIPVCGGNINADSGSIATPGWPVYYPSLDFTCEWTFKTSNNSIFDFTFAEEFGVMGSHPCSSDYIEIFDGLRDTGPSMGRFCSLSVPASVCTSSNCATIVFKGSSLAHPSDRIGANVTFTTLEKVNECETNNGGCEQTCMDQPKSYLCTCRAGYILATNGRDCDDIDECSGSQSGYCEHICVNTEGSFHCICSGSFALADDGRSCVPVCGGNIDADSGSIATPGWPVYYPSLDFTCEWTFKTSNNSIFDFAFAEEFGVMGSHPCSSDYIEIFDGLRDTGPSLGRFCSLSVPASVCTSSNCATIVFKGSSLAHPSDRVGANVTFTTLEKVNECETNNGGCEQTCVDQPKSYLCNCRAGYTLATNGRDCDDIDECSGSQSGYCEHICVNTEGSFHCICSGSFALADDGRSCVPVCGGNIDVDSGSIATPGWPVYYPSLDFTCEWTFKTSNNSLFDFAFAEQFGVMGSHPCSSDYIEIFDGLRDTGPSLGRFCSLSVPVSVCTSSNCATIVFKGSSLAHPSDRVGANVTFTTLEKVNECETNNGGCEQTCMDQPKSYLCTCRAGYTLATNGRDCDDIDECSVSENCEETCVNTEGSYHCACSGDFVVASDGRSCVPDCGGTLTESTGTFSTPGWPIFYPSLDFRCVWVIDVTNHTESLNHTDAVLDIVFNSPFGIHGRPPCPTDYAEVLDGVGEEAGGFGKSCFLGAPDPVLTSSGTATVIFQASTNRHTRSRVGISVTYRTVLFNVNECDDDYGGCEQVCIDTLRSFTCACGTGYTLNPDGRGCTDINECSSSSLHGCEQLCVNTEGTYGCACRDGYALDSNNGRTCSLDCGGRLTGTSGSFHTPGWPERYPQLDFRCVWTVDSIPEQHSAVFVVDDSAYGINGAPPCRTDYIEFFDSADHNGASLGKHCMLEVPDPVRISTDGARVVFQGRRNSNRPANRVGTRVFYYIDENECLTDNGGCEGTCSNTYTSYVCSCRGGLQLTDDRHSCEDADECELNTHECDQLCINRDGYYECECQEGFYLAPNGKLCIPTCGGHFDKPNGTFHTPGWPDFYPELDFFCEWTIDINNTFLSENRSIALQFTFDDSAYGLGDPSTCYQDYIEFYNDIDSNAQLSEKICSNTVPSPFAIISTQVKIVFRGSSRPHTDGEVGARVIFNIVEQEFGPPPCSASEVLDFNGDCRSVECGGTLFAMSGVLQPPNWPNSSPNVLSCQWAIVLPDISKRVLITLVEIDISRDVRSTCFWNYVIFFDTTLASGIPPLIGNDRFCGTRPPNPLVASGNIVNIWYQSRLPPNRGFSLSFSAV